MSAAATFDVTRLCDEAKALAELREACGRSVGHATVARLAEEIEAALLSLDPSEPNSKHLGARLLEAIVDCDRAIGGRVRCVMRAQP